TRFGIGEDAFTLGGDTSPDDLLLQLELMCAYIKDPGWRDEALDQARRNLAPLFAQLQHQVTGPLQTDFLPKIYGGDARFGLASQDKMQAVTIPQLRAWLDPVLKSAAIELTVVGDVDADKVVAAAARTFGALPQRSAPADISAKLAIKPAAGLHEDTTVQT